MTEADLALRWPRRWIVIGAALPIAGTLAESATGNPQRFPDWYYTPFWLAASALVLIVAALAIVSPSTRRIQAFGSIVVVWCLCRAALNLATRPLPWPGGVSVAIWVGLASTVYGVGLAASINSGRAES